MNPRKARHLCIIAFSAYESDARIRREAETAAQFGFDVDIITPRARGESRRDTFPNVTLHRVGVPRYVGPETLAYLASYLRFFCTCFFLISWLHLKKKYEIVHVNNMPDFLVFTTLVTRLSGAKIVLDIHDPMPETYAAKFGYSERRFWRRILLLQEKASAAYANIVLTVHEPLKRDVLMKHGLREEKIVVIRNFADERIFKPASKYQISDQVRMIFHGTIAERFDLEAVLRAILNVPSRHRLYLKIIGKGDYGQQLTGLIRELGLQDTVDFENVVYPLPRLPGILENYHLGLVPYHPSRATDYMLPVKLMELMAMGIPAITITNVPIGYYIDESMYFSYNPRDMDTLTGLLETIIQNPALVLKKRDEILSHRNRFIWKNERGKYVAILESLSSRGLDGHD